MIETADLPDLLVGAVLAGRYHVVRRVAAGGMGVVYEARQEPLGRRVALKVIRGDATDPIARLRFEREARSASALQDAHVVVVHDFGVIEGGVADGGLFLAMEFVEGDTLRQRLSAAGRLPWVNSRPLVRQIAQALAAAHARNLVHRDLKPENVMLVLDDSTNTSMCKVLDFGLAKGTGHDALLRAGSEPLTRSGGFVGTPGYISPEVIDGAGDAPQQDVYALGVVWWELLTGRHPFPAETPMKTLVRQMHEEAPVVDDALRATDGIPPGGAELLRDMMARDPARRPKDGGAVLARLDALVTPSVSRSLPSTDGIDGSADTIAGNRSSLSSQPLPKWPDRQEARTVEERLRPAPHTPAAVTQTSLTPPPPPPSPQAVLPLTPRRRWRLAWLVAIVGAIVLGASATLVFEHTVDGISSTHEIVMDAGNVSEPHVVVDAGVVITELVVKGLPTYSVFKALRTHLGTHTLRVYRVGEGELAFKGDVAADVADVLQDLEFDADGQHFSVEVGDVAGRRVVVTITAGPVTIVLEDAGFDIAPGGLEP